MRTENINNRSYQATCSRLFRRQVRDQLPFARYPLIMKQPVRVCTHVNVSREFRRFPSRRLFLRATCNTLLCRVQKGPQPPRIPIFPIRFRRFDMLQPSESSGSLLFPGPARFPQPEISSRGKGKFLFPPRDGLAILRGSRIYYEGNLLRTILLSFSWFLLLFLSIYSLCTRWWWHLILYKCNSANWR